MKWGKSVSNTLKIIQVAFPKVWLYSIDHHKYSIEKYRVSWTKITPQKIEITKFLDQKLDGRVTQGTTESAYSSVDGVFDNCNNGSDCNSRHAIFLPKNIILTAYDQGWLMLTGTECWITPNLFNSSQRS